MSSERDMEAKDGTGRFTGEPQGNPGEMYVFSGVCFLLAFFLHKAHKVLGVDASAGLIPVFLIAAICIGVLGVLAAISGVYVEYYRRTQETAVLND